jgi:signal transduction histidine kinase
MTSPETRPWAWQSWYADALVGCIVLVAGIIEVVNTDHVAASRSSMVLVALATAVAVSLSRQAPATALVLVWMTGVLQVSDGVPIMRVQLAIALVAFGTARWGSAGTVVASALSVPAGAFVALLIAKSDRFGTVINLAHYKRLLETTYQLGGTWEVTATILAVALLGMPWLAGLVLRFSTRAAESRVLQQAAQEDAARAQRESEQALEIARLRDEQATLARDVHDVVGHSLAVILAQAESAQFLDDDPSKLKTTMATIATSARGSLQDVRHVLSATAAPATSQHRELDSLIDGVRASGHEVVSHEVGPPQPLPPELEVVAFRVLQEMLTNAITHGRRDQPVVVERHWAGSEAGGVADLRIEVRNVENPADPADGEARPGSGQGLEGMRRRLEAVGGRMDVRRREDHDGTTFTTTAWVPVRAR